MPRFLFNQHVVVEGDKEVFYKLRSTRAVVLEEMLKAAEESAKLLDLGRQYHVPRRTETLASALFSEVSIEPGATSIQPRVVIRLGTRDYASYGVYVDDGSGIYHVPDPHLPWVQKSKTKAGRTKEHVHFGQPP